MRVTNQMIVAGQLAGIQSNLDAIDKAQTRVSSGKRLTAASDDPTAAVNIMSADTALRAIAQYKTNVQRASDRVSTEDSVLQQLGDLLTRAQEISVQQGSSTATADTRAAAQAEVQSLLQSAVQLGNTTFGNEFLFGGDASTTAPFSTSGLNYSTTNPTGGRQIAIGDGESMTISHNGTQVFLATGVLDALKSLGTALSANDVAGINNATASVSGAFDNVQSLVGEVGARGNQLNMTSSSLDAYEATVTQAKSNLEDVDAPTAITELTSRQTAYQAALLAVSRTSSMNLTDYLK